MMVSDFGDTRNGQAPVDFVLLDSPDHLREVPMHADFLVMLTKRYRVHHSCAVDTGDHRAADYGVTYPACPNLHFEGTSDWGNSINERYTSLSKALLRVQGKPYHNQYRYDDGLYFFH